MSALENQQALSVRLAEARIAVAEAEAERRRAPRLHESARAALRGYYAALDAGAEPDPERERELTSRMNRLGASLVVRARGNGTDDVRCLAAEERLLAAKLAVEDLERELAAYRWTNTEALAAELAERARELADRYRPIALEVAALEREYSGELASWRQMLEPLGLALSDLPESPAQSTRFTTVMPPMPRALMRPDEMTPALRAASEARERERRFEEAEERAAVELAAARDASEAAS